MRTCQFSMSLTVIHVCFLVQTTASSHTGSRTATPHQQSRGLCMSWTIVRACFLVQTTTSPHMGSKATPHQQSSGLYMRVAVAPQQQTFPCRVLIVVCKINIPSIHPKALNAQSTRSHRLLLDALANHGRGANGGGASHERDNGPLYQRAGGYARRSASAQDAARGRAPGEPDHRGRGTTRSPTRRKTSAIEETSPVTIYVPSPPPSEEKAAEGAEDVEMVEQPSSHRAREPTMVERPSSHKAAAPMLMRPTPKTLRKKEVPQREEKAPEGKSDSYEMMGNDSEAWRRFMEARAARDAALKAKKEHSVRKVESKKKKPAKERKPVEERPVVREPSGPPPDYLTGPTRKGKRRFASSGWLTWIIAASKGHGSREQRCQRSLLSGLSETSSRVPPDVGAAHREHEELHGGGAIRTGASPAGPCRLEHLEAGDGRATGARDWTPPGERARSPRPRTGPLHGIRDRRLTTPDNGMEIVVTEEAVPEPSAAPKAAGATISVSDSDEDNWGGWRPAKAGAATPDATRGASIPEPTTPPARWQQPPMEPIAANATVTEHTRGPTPRHGRSELKATPPWRESLSSRGFRGPHLQLHLSTPGHTSEGLQALGPLRESFLRMQAKDHAQLPVSLTPSKAASDLPAM